MARSARIGLLGALLLALGAPSGALGALVFDFEDGLQGWSVSGSVTRVPTQVLGGSYAIFGDGLWRGEPSPRLIPESNLLSQVFDLSHYGRMTVEFHYAGGFEDVDATAFLRVGAVRVAGDFIVVDSFDVLGMTRTSERSGTVTFDLGGISADTPVGIQWGIFGPPLCDSGPCTELPSDAAIGFIDNITFLPEPAGVLLLAAAGLVGILRRSE